MRRKSILCFGGLVLDSYLLLNEGEMEKYGVQKGKMALYDDLTPPEQMQQMRRDYKFTDFEMGGSAINTVKAYSVLGGSAGLVCTYGNDKGRELAESECQRLNINLLASQNKDYPTSYLMILVTPDAQRTVVGSFYPSFHIDSSQIDYSKIGEYDYSFLEAYSFTDDPKHDAIFKVLENIEKCNGRFIFALSNAFCTSKFRKEVTEFVNHNGCKVIIGNVQEFMGIYPEFDKADDLVNHILNHNRKHSKWELVVITDGANGAWLIHNHDLLFVPAPEVDKVVDTTGAGDYFAAGAIFALVNGYGLKDAAYLGNLLAGDIISRVGVTLSEEAISEAKQYISKLQ